MYNRSSNRRHLSLAGILLFVLIVIIAAICLLKSNRRSLPDSHLGVYKKAAVVTNGPECSQVGVDILKQNGTAVDAAIAALLCEGVASLQSMGLGGGFLMTIYDAKTGTADYIDARETAPSRAFENMYHGNANLSLRGGLGVAVPGELKGYMDIHAKYGSNLPHLQFKDLFKGAIEVAEKGSVVTQYLYDLFKDREELIKKEPTLAEILINPKTKKLWGVGEKIRRPKLAKTLKSLSHDPDDFYYGEMAHTLVREINEFGGIMTMADFQNYKTIFYSRDKASAPIEAHFKNMTMYSAPLPGSGVLLTFMLNILDGLLPVKDEKIMWQRITETFKWAYAVRTELGDPKFVPEMKNIIKNLTSRTYADSIRKLIKDNVTHNSPKFYGAVTTQKDDHGTAHVVVLAPDGSAVSATSTINQILGGKFRSNSTGIIFNDEMDDFSSPNMTNGFDLPPSPHNFIRPGKRPLSSMTPTIVVGPDKKVRLIIGAAGGTKITTALVICMVQNLWNGKDIKESIDTLRIHHQLFPMAIQSETNFPTDILNYLHKIGHKSTTFSGIGSAVTAIAQENGVITANSDYRRQGTTAGF